MKRSIVLISLALIALLVVFPGLVSQAASASRAIAPSAINTIQGGTAGQPVANLAVMDQSGSADDPSKYVTFTTPGTIYKGTCEYVLPAGISPATITAIKVRANYKGPLVGSQIWTWYLYDWTAAKWVNLGNNSAANAGTWTLLSFPTTSPKRFVSSTRAIRVLLQSNNNTRWSMPMPWQTAGATGRGAVSRITLPVPARCTPGQKPLP